MYYTSGFGRLVNSRGKHFSRMTAEMSSTRILTRKYHLFFFSAWSLKITGPQILST